MVATLSEVFSLSFDLETLSGLTSSNPETGKNPAGFAVVMLSYILIAEPPFCTNGWIESTDWSMLSGSISVVSCVFFNVLFVSCFILIVPVLCLDVSPPHMNINCVSPSFCARSSCPLWEHSSSFLYLDFVKLLTQGFVFRPEFLPYAVYGYTGAGEVQEEASWHRRDEGNHLHQGESKFLPHQGNNKVQFVASCKLLGNDGKCG